MPRYDRYTEKELAYLKEAYENGDRLIDIAWVLKRDPRYLGRKAKELGFIRYPDMPMIPLHYKKLFYIHGEPFELTVKELAKARKITQREELLFEWFSGVDLE